MTVPPVMILRLLKCAWCDQRFARYSSATLVRSADTLKVLYAIHEGICRRSVDPHPVAYEPFSWEAFMSMKAIVSPVLFEPGWIYVAVNAFLRKDKK